MTTNQQALLRSYLEHETPEYLPMFTYGTLRPGECNHHIVANTTDTILDGSIKGFEMVSNGGFPYIIDADEDHEIQGSLFFVKEDEFPMVSWRMDMLEGTRFDPMDDRNHYTRQKRTVSTEQGEFEAWVYVPPLCDQAHLRETLTLVPSGNWDDAPPMSFTYSSRYFTARQ